MDRQSTKTNRKVFHAWMFGFSAAAVLLVVVSPFAWWPPLGLMLVLLMGVAAFFAATRPAHAPPQKNRCYGDFCCPAVQVAYFNTAIRNAPN